MAGAAGWERIRHGRPLDGALAALATLAVSMPLLTLLSPASWFRPAFALVALVALSGVLLRAVTASVWLVAGGQLVLTALGFFLLHARGHLWFGLPTPDAVRSVGILLGQAVDTAGRYAAPAPTDRGLIVAVGLALAATALFVDVLAVTLRAPALSGTALLAAYVAGASNTGTSLPLYAFVLPALAWLALLGRHGVSSVRRWGTSVPRAADDPAGGADPESGFAALGRALGLVALVLAVVVPASVPHLPTTFLADGLGRADGARGSSAGRIRLDDTLDLTRNLADPSEAAVLTYRTDADAPSPLRVDVASLYSAGQWYGSGGNTRVRPDRDGRGDISDKEEELPAPEVEQSRSTVRVSNNRVLPPQLAVPTPLTGLDIDAGWAVDPAGSVRVARSLDVYVAEYAQISPRALDFTVDTPPLALDGTLDVDEASADAVRAASERAVPDAASPLETARAIQAYLRGPEFSYSLELAGPVRDDDGQPVRLEPLTHFLVTKRGYCVQFASAMTMMARSEGIPARVAIGFLPGSLVGDEYTVRAADAHAWPELYFPRLGWVRFEPTPGTRSGTAPAYTMVPTDDTAAQETPGAAAPTPSASATTRQDGDLGAVGQQGAGGGDRTLTRWASDNVTLLALLLAGLLGVLVVPFGAWWRRGRARRCARDDPERVEVEWAALLSRLEDIGVAPPRGATPRQAGRHVEDAAYLAPEPGAALGRVVSSVEQARYAAPGGELPDVRSDARAVWRAAAGARARRVRLRAVLLPSDGLRQWQDVRARLRRLPAAALGSSGRLRRRSERQSR